MLLARKEAQSAKFAISVEDFAKPATAVCKSIGVATINVLQVDASCLLLRIRTDVFNHRDLSLVRIPDRLANFVTLGLIGLNVAAKLSPVGTTKFGLCSARKAARRRSIVATGGLDGLTQSVQRFIKNKNGVP